MPILKNTTADNGAAVGFHKAVSANYNMVSGAVNLIVSSWTDATSYNAGTSQVWQWHLVATAACLTNIEAYLLTVDPFTSGTIVSDDSTSLDSQKARQWALVKASRDTAMSTYFTWDSSKFDSDDLSQSRITGGVVLAQLALAQSQPFSMTWTLYDNTTRVLAATDMVAVGVALGTFVQGLIDKGTAYRNQIDAATDAASVQAITWQS